MADASALATALTAGLVTCALVPAVRALMVQRGVLDEPNDRSSHATVTPRGGGIASAAGVLAGGLVGEALGFDVPWIALVAAMALALVGFVDDRAGLAAIPRLAAQLIVGGVLGWNLGGPVWTLAGALITVVAVNVVNFMDGINGITALSMIVWGAATAGFASGIGNQGLVVLGAMQLGAAAGFLPWNSPRARIFLGDVGSYLFGTLSAGAVVLALLHGGVGSGAIVLAPAAFYLTDVFVTLIRRTLKGHQIGAPHRDHVYQRMTTVVQRHTPVAFTLATLAAISAALAQFAPPSIAIGSIAALCVTYLILPKVIPIANLRKMQSDDH